MRFILLTGLSGAGKTASLRYLEDMGCLYVDNLPSAMVLRFVELCAKTAGRAQMIIMAVDIRSGDLFDAHALRNMIAGARATGWGANSQVSRHRGISSEIPSATDIRVLFLEASDDALVGRFKETRRDHPLLRAAGDLVSAIRLERERLQPLREMADIIVDTTGLRVSELREKLAFELLTDEQQSERRVRAEIVSFGFKRGAPRDADLVFDVRFLPNPFYVDDIRFQTGLSAAVRDYVLGAPVAQEFLRKISDMLIFLMPHYQSEGKRRLFIGIGCTGGAHRSVAISEALGEALRAAGYTAAVSHRDIELEQANWSHP